MDITESVLSKLSSQIGALTVQCALKDSVIETLREENAKLKAQIPKDPKDNERAKPAGRVSDIKDLRS